MSKGEEYIKMPINPLMTKDFLLNKYPMYSGDNPTGHKHNQNIPIALIERKDTNNAGPKPGQKATKAIIFIE